MAKFLLILQILGSVALAFMAGNALAHQEARILVNVGGAAIAFLFMAIMMIISWRK